MKRLTKPDARRPNLGSGQDRLNALVSLYSRGRLKEALSLGTSLTVQYPRVPLIPNILGAVYAGLSRKQEAVASYRKALSLKSDYAEAHNNLGVALNDLGKHEEALTSFASALKIRPDYSEAHTNRGNTLKNLGRHEDAIASHRQAILLRPDFAGAHNNLGNAYHEIGKHEEAVASYSTAIQIRPDYAEAHSNLGNALKNLGRYDEAIASYERAIKSGARQADVLNNLAHVLKAQGDNEGAIARLSRAIRIKPDFVEAHTNLCELLERLNRLSEFKVALKNADKGCPKDHPSILYLKGMLAFREKQFQAARSILETIDPSRLPISEQILFQNLLGQVYDKLGQYKFAFERFRKSNEIILESNTAKRYIESNYIEKIQSLINSYDSEEKAVWNNKRSDESAAAPIFLVGFPRSGTTLLDTILRGHPDISVMEEKPLIHSLRTHLDDDERFEKISGLLPSEITAMRDTYFRQMNLYLDKDKSRSDSLQHRVIDKFPLNITSLGVINRVFPESKVIFVLRHPCDCMLSCFMQNFSLNNAMVNLLEIQNCAVLYDRIMTLWEQYKRILSFECCVVKYEDLIEDLDKTLAPLLKFLGVDWNSAVLRYQDTASNREQINTPSYRQVTEPLYKSARGRWINYKSELEPVLPLLQPWISKWGYD
jgi:tetratricopeptide (TPR) repeat protein